MEVVDILGSVANVLILLLIASGIPASIKIRRNQSVENISHIPFSLGFFNSCLWLNYGLLLANPGIYLINIIAAVLNSFYLGCYYCFCPDEAFMHKLFLSMTTGLGVVVGYTSFLSSAEHGIWVAGFLSSAVTMSFVAAPLLELRTVIQKKSTASLPLFFILMNFLLGLLFFVYGYLLQDIFVQVPNAIGVVVSVIVLSFYAIYPSKPVNKSS